MSEEESQRPTVLRGDVDDKTWAIERLGDALSSAAGTYAYKQLLSDFDEKKIDAQYVIRGLMKLAAPLFGDDKILFDLAEATLIPGLREVNDELSDKIGKIACLHREGNRFEKITLEPSKTRKRFSS